MRAFVALLSLAACDRVFLTERQPPVADALLDTDTRRCGGVGFVTLCTAIEDDDIALRDTIDTTGDPRCSEPLTRAGFDDACVITAANITVPFPVRVVGARPLILFADTITVGAPIDASSRRSAASGAGARLDCAPPNGTATATFGGGGPGGSHQFAGGPGGSGGVTNPAPTTPPTAAFALLTLAGGCSGGGGGGNSSITPSGSGGGAVYAIGRMSITITDEGGINVSGAGGGGGATRHGGGGGGAGGTIGLDAPAITIAGNLIAKGGGGGGGGGNATNGLPGREADLAGVFAGVSGGAGGDASPGNGGDGSNGTTGGLPGNGAFGGGGGGGAAGYILLYGERMITGQINPAP